MWPPRSASRRARKSRPSRSICRRWPRWPTLPLGEQQRQRLDALAPRGRLQDFSAQWEGDMATPASYRLRGKLVELGLNAQPARLAVAKTATSPAQAAAPPFPASTT
jgi:hypothetical protein